jgi:hypothetical protein
MDVYFGRPLSSDRGQQLPIQSNRRNINDRRFYRAFLESTLHAHLRIHACHSVGYGFGASTAGVGLNITKRIEPPAGDNLSNF